MTSFSVSDPLSAPETEASLEERLTRLSPAKRALLEQRLRQKPASGHGQPIPRRRDQTSAPLSSAQQRLWFLHQWEPDSPVYNSPLLLCLRGELRTDALQQALDALVTRHEILRTVFGWRDGEPVQMPLPPCPVMLRRVTGETGAEEEPVDDAPLPAWVLEEARAPFDLASTPLLRAALGQTGPDSYLLLLSVPHLVFDGWSRGVLLRDLAALYNGFAGGTGEPLPPLPIQYGDYAAWQQARLGTDILRKQLGYWKKQLAGMPPALALPSDHPRPPVPSYRGAHLHFRVPASLLQGLLRLSQAEGATLFMTLLAAFQSLLMRYTDQTDVVIGTPIAGRMQPETEALIGCFVNTLALRTDLSGEPTFRDALARARGTCLDAYAHQELPFERLVQEMQPPRDLSRSPLVQVMLVLQNTPRSEAVLAGLTAVMEEVDTRTAKFDLTLTLTPDSDGLRGVFQYSADLFDRATITRLQGHFLNFLESIVADPNQSLGDVPLLTKAERHQLLVEWNTMEAGLPREGCLHHFLEAQAVRTPNAAALAFQDHRLTYSELNVRADHLADVLRRRGVGPEVLVGLCMERSPDAVIAMFAILKAGGAYVPLDPHYPPERIAFLLSDAHVPLLLTQQKLLERLPPHAGQTICLDGDWDSLVPDSPPVHSDNAGPSNPAYVIYTSGSTGKPKGVVIEHRSAVAFVDYFRSVFSQEDLAVTLASASFCFDFSVFELFVPLSMGGMVRLVENALTLQASSEADDVTLISGVPSAITELLRAHRVPPDVRVIVLGGETLPQKLVRDLYAQTPARSVVNIYGPTEDTVCSTYARVRPDVAEAPPIGRPIKGTQAYVLDAAGQPAPIGIPGELYLGGRGLARGYLHRPDLTAEKFISNPFDTEPGSRLYRTGDRVRWRADGELEFLGRLDHQIKLRGFRIELGEIETVLATHPAIREAMVAVREDTPGDQRLVAYLVPNSTQPPETGDLRAYLRNKLPEYMIPAAFVFPASLPQTQNGKRSRALPPAAAWTSGEAGEYTAPRTPLEETLCAIWAALLKRDQVGIHDNFFECGGHSLLAMQALSRMQGTLGLEMPLRLLFETPTVAGCADVLQRSRDSSDADLDVGTLYHEAHQTDLPEPAMAALTPREAFAPSPSLLHMMLQEIWQDLLGVHPVDIRDNFFDLGGHSLLAARLLERVLQATGRRIPLAALFAEATIEHLASVILSEEEEGDGGLIAVQPSGAKPPLFFLHGDFHGGGLYCRALARQLGLDQPFYALPPLGLNGEEVPLSLAAIADVHVTALRRFQPMGPYRLGGFCNGGLIAYEMARHLEAQGQNVEALILVHASPQTRRFRPVQRHLRRWGTCLGISEITLHHGIERLRAARGRALAYLKRHIKRKASVENRTVPPRSKRDELRDLYWTLIGYYRPGPYSGPVSLFWPAEAPSNTSEPTQGWAKAARSVTVVTVPGDHFSCVTSHVKALADSIGLLLESIPEHPAANDPLTEASASG